MKKFLLTSFTLITVIAIGSFVFQANADKGNTSLEVGSKAPMIEKAMIGIDGNETTLSSAKRENGLLVIFSSNTCPFVIYWEDRYPELFEMCKDKNIGMLVVNSNEAKRDNEDSMEEMKKHAKENKYKFSYVIDEKSALANAFGAKTTPHVYLFDESMRLAYSGAIDDNYRDRNGVEQAYLSNAIIKMVKGEKIDPNVTKPVGCSIKRIKI